MDHDSVTQWLVNLHHDERTAAEQLWQRYWNRVAGMARTILSAYPRGAADEQDVAQSVIRTFFRRVRDGRFPRLENRRDLWNLLVTITIRKALKQRRRQSRQALTGTDAEFIQQALSREPEPDIASMLRDEVQHLVGLLDEPMQRVAALLLEGCTNEEAAARCGVSLATIERRRQLIRKTWRRAGEE
jgi:RNA polymerase sigma factor (sigma-70 family)